MLMMARGHTKCCRICTQGKASSNKLTAPINTRMNQPIFRKLCLAPINSPSMIRNKGQLNSHPGMKKEIKLLK